MRRNKSCPLYSQLRPQKRIFALRHVRFTHKSGHVQCTSACPLWANSGHCATYSITSADVLEGVSLWQCIFVDLAVFHDDLEVLGGIGDQVDIVQRISVNKQQIRECPLFHDAKLSWIRATL